MTLPFLWLLLSFGWFHFTLALDSQSSALGRCTPTIPSKFTSTLQHHPWHTFLPNFITRGGETKSTTLSNVVTNSAASNQPVSSSQSTSKAKVPTTSSNPFQLLQNIREEVASASDTIHGDDDKSSKAELDSSSSMNLVGGAATLTHSPKLSNSQTIRSLEETSIPSNVLTEQNAAAKSSSTSGDRESVHKEKAPSELPGRSDVSRLWWVNIWTQQLEEMTDDDDEEEESSVQDSVGVYSIDSKEDGTEQLNTQEDREHQSAKSESIPSTPSSPKSEEITTKKKEKEQQKEGEIKIELVEADKRLGIESLYVSSGLWSIVDSLLTLGLARLHPALRISNKLRGLRKACARITGLHGFLSGKPSVVNPAEATVDKSIDKSNEFGITTTVVTENQSEATLPTEERQGRKWSFLFGLQEKEKDTELDAKMQEKQEQEKRLAEELEAKRIRSRENQLRMMRVREIDALIAENQQRLQQLICEKDLLQRRPNPLFNYTNDMEHEHDLDNISRQKAEETAEAASRLKASRNFNFPPRDLVEEYLDMVLSSGRLNKLNHSFLWQEGASLEEEEEESIGDDFRSPSVHAYKLYKDSGDRSSTSPAESKSSKTRNGGGGGSWLLRQSIGKGPSIGEKLGEVAETATYRAVCAAVMSLLARAISSLHGANVMKHSDIRLIMEEVPDLPPMGGRTTRSGSSADSQYARETIESVMRQQARNGKTKKLKGRSLHDQFIQRDAVTETLLSHVQVAAPLLKLFPLAWQRAFLGNIVTLTTAIMSDFFDGLQFQLLGHSLTFSFSPITEEDLMNNFGDIPGMGFNPHQRKTKPEEFESAVRATAEDLSERLKFLDKWYERALGSGVIRNQIAHLIARLVLTLIEDVLTGARIDLWSAQAGGQRMLAGLEFRSSNPSE